MNGRCDGRGRRGFALIEGAAILVVGVLLLAMLLIVGGESRRSARLGEDIGKLRRIGAWTTTYSADNSDQFWSFSWQKNKAYTSSSSTMPLWPPAASDLQAQGNQAVDILHRVAGRKDISPIVAWFANTGYSHLVLVDAFKSEVPNLTFVSAGDRNRLLWARDPEGFDSGQYQPAPTGSPPGTNTGKRWPYSSSFQLSTSFFEQSSVPNRIYQAGNHSQYFVPNGTLGPQLRSTVAYPSQKVHLFDGAGWHFGPRVSHFAFAEMRLPLLFTDGGVQVRASGDANQGWHPNQPAAAGFAMQYNYTPDAWEPPTPNGSPTQFVTEGRYRWTRGYLAGRDLDGPEACTGQPGCP